MNKRRAVLISVEGLGTNLIGAYGNSVAPTPNIDSLASRGIVLDQLWGDGVSAVELLESWWTGCHALERSSCEPRYTPWGEAIRSGLLVTDSREVAEGNGIDRFERVLFVASEGEEESDLLGFERLVQVALGAWSEVLDEQPFLWIHTRGLRGTWDAPYELRELLCDEGDPDPPRDTEPMAMRVVESTDPDEIFQISCAVGGQTMFIDQVIGELQRTLDELEISDQCLAGLLGVNGFPLGEHRQVGGESLELYAESLHVPCILRPGNTIHLGVRHSVMMQPHEVGEWISEWFREGSTDEAFLTSLEEMVTPSFDGESSIGAAIAIEGGVSYVHTPAWACRITESDQHPPATELFAKPDDRWEQNDVSTRAVHVVEKMMVLKSKLETHYRTPVEERATLNWIDEELVQLHR